VLLGRLPFIAPEVREGIYTEKSDIYSLGIIIWQLVSKVVFPSPEIMLSNPEVYRIEPVPSVPKWYEVRVLLLFHDIIDKPCHQD
jgi:serine/threonine protein kinase